MTTIAEAFTALAEQSNKSFAEITAKIAESAAAFDALSAQLADRDLTPEEQAAFDAAKASMQALDDIVPDPVETTPPPVEEVPAPEEPAPVEETPAPTEEPTV